MKLFRNAAFFFFSLSIAFSTESFAFVPFFVSIMNFGCPTNGWLIEYVDTVTFSSFLSSSFSALQNVWSVPFSSNTSFCVLFSVIVISMVLKDFFCVYKIICSKCFLCEYFS